ncbi:hypothetical protein HW555_011009 [Spodoptera exigua]|uniref:Uncharacterized protein n=1 Tax=Spodoptera exigua TaxID=7107 RepID=A0A835KZA3_SPOEX|nr:hypothetical protein HW555_011009 [Spodoptera exigua]
MGFQPPKVPQAASQPQETYLASSGTWSSVDLARPRLILDVDDTIMSPTSPHAKVLTRLHKYTLPGLCKEFLHGNLGAPQTSLCSPDLHFVSYGGKPDQNRSMMVSAGLLPQPVTYLNGSSSEIEAQFCITYAKGDIGLCVDSLPQHHQAAGNAHRFGDAAVSACRRPVHEKCEIHQPPSQLCPLLGLLPEFEPQLLSSSCLRAPPRNSALTGLSTVRPFNTCEGPGRGCIDFRVDDHFCGGGHRFSYKVARGVVGVIGVVHAAGCVSRHGHNCVGNAVVDGQFPGLGVNYDDAVVGQTLRFVYGQCARALSGAVSLVNKESFFLLTMHHE